MIGPAWAGLLLGTAAQAPAGVHLAQVTIRSRMVVRVQADAPPPPIRYEERKGPHCLAMADIAGAGVIAGNSVDFVLRGGDRVRARFSSSCPALDYYSGFYIAPTADGKICSDRDVVRSRAGGECPIDRFRMLVPAKEQREGPLKRVIRRLSGRKP